MTEPDLYMTLILKPRHKTIVTRQIASIRHKIERSDQAIFRLRGERSRILDELARSNGSVEWSKTQTNHIELSIKARFKHIGRWRRLLADLYRELGEVRS